MQAEIEKVKKRREERALEKAQHEEEMVSTLICEAQGKTHVVPPYVHVSLVCSGSTLPHNFTKFAKPCHEKKKNSLHQRKTLCTRSFL